MKSKFRILSVVVFFIFPFLTQAQVTIGSGIEPNLGSLLDLKERQPDGYNANSDKGLLLSRIVISSETDLSPAVNGASGEDKMKHTGMLVYHIGSAELCAGVYTWNGDRWERLPKPCVIATDCSSVTVNGVYSVGQALNSTNTITLEIEVPREAADGTYNIYTDVQNGISFSGTGNLTEGRQMITLMGSGTPISGGIDMQFKIDVTFSNSAVSATTCSTNIHKDIIPIGRTKIFGFGLYPGTYGYFLDSSAAKAMMLSPNNFGTNDNSVVRSSGFDIVSSTLGSLTEANFVTSLTAGLGVNPDIIVNGYYSYTSSSAVIDKLAEYLQKGGVLILFDEYSGAANNISLRLLKKLFPVEAASISYKVVGGASSVYAMTTTVDDEITNGPFGDVRGKIWGEDYSSTYGFTGMHSDSIIVYSNADVLGGSITSSNAPKTNPGYVTMFRHKRLNLFIVGDGGFTSNINTYIGPGYSSATACPFAIDASFAPIPRTGWGTYGPTGGGKFTVYNSQIFANIMAWAVKNAPSNNYTP